MRKTSDFIAELPPMKNNIPDLTVPKGGQAWRAWQFIQRKRIAIDETSFAGEVVEANSTLDI